MRFQLSALQSRFEATVDQVELDLVTAMAIGRREHVVTAERSLVHLQDSYGRFVRDLIVRSSLGNADSASGLRLQAGLQGTMRQREALDYLRLHWPGRSSRPSWWEPSWYLPREWAIALRLLGPQNGGGISAALGSSTNPSEDMRRIRNFAVHRGPSSAGEMASVQVVRATPGWAQPCDIVAGSAPIAFSQWCARLRAISRAAVK